MTIFDRWRSDQPKAATDLDSYFDALDSGVLAPRTELDSSIAAVASRIHQAGIRTAEPAGLRSQLWEDLMQNATRIDADSLAAPIPPDSRSLRDVSLPFGSPPRSNRDRSGHTFEWIAAAILVLGVFGAAFIFERRGDGNPSPGSALLAPGSATPELPCDETSLENSASLPPCVNILEYLSSNLVGADLMDDSEHQVELQGWAITPGSTYHGPSGSDSASGAVVDFVLSGAYVATFNVPVTVQHSGYALSTFEYLDAGEPVELVRGDSVSYKLGGLVEVYNPLSTQHLEFKRAVIFTGNASTFSATSEGVTTKVEGTRTLPLSLSDGDLQPTLYYIQRYPGSSALPPYWSNDFIIGPVDPQTGSDGFVLVIGPPKG